KKHLISNSGHAPFWDSPDRFDPIFERFLKNLEPSWR
ncbi:MAG: alpha/beta hydrolase, partial [Mesorhizobium sp.]